MLRQRQEARAVAREAREKEMRERQGHWQQMFEAEKAANRERALAEKDKERVDAEKAVAHDTFLQNTAAK